MRCHARCFLQLRLLDESNNDRMVVRVRGVEVRMTWSSRSSLLRLPKVLPICLAIGTNHWPGRLHNRAAVMVLLLSPLVARRGNASRYQINQHPFPLLMTAITFISYFSPADINIEVSFQRAMSAKPHRMLASHYILLAVGRFGIPRKVAPTCS